MSWARACSVHGGHLVESPGAKVGTGLWCDLGAHAPRAWDVVNTRTGEVLAVGLVDRVVLSEGLAARLEDVLHELAAAAGRPQVVLPRRAHRRAA